MVVGGGVVGVAATTADKSRLAAAATTAAETALLKPVADVGDGRGPRRSCKNKKMIFQFIYRCFL